MDLGSEHQTLCIHEQMALRMPLTFLPPSYPLSSHPCGLHRLAIYYARAGLRLSFHADTQTFSQGGVQPLPGACSKRQEQVFSEVSNVK